MKRNYILPKSTEVLINPEDLIAQSSMVKTDVETEDQWARHNDDNVWDTEW